MDATVESTRDELTTSSTWSIDPAHTNAEFAVKHMMLSTVKGHFADVSGTIVLDAAQPENCKVEVSIPTATIDTRSKQRDDHLRSADFFATDEFPVMKFTSREVRPLSDNEFEVAGDLTIRDTTREVLLMVNEEGRGRDPWGNEKVAFSASTAIDRRDFGLTWNAALEAGGVLVGEKVKIQLDVQAVRA
jgi:polyisoprenoid-binding protein YceI